MPDEIDTPETEESRPWHGHDAPLEGFYQWVKAEIARVEGKTPSKPEAPYPQVTPAPIEAQPAAQTTAEQLAPFQESTIVPASTPAA